MGFADAYLLKAGLREALIAPEPHAGLNIIVTIPVNNESGLERCLDSFFKCSCNNDSGKAGADSGSFHAEVLILINAPANAPAEILEQNLATLEATRAWIKAHPHPCMDFHVWLDHSFGKKESGVGTARKILMDEALRRFNILERPEGIIASMDADAVVRPNYLEALQRHFQGNTLSDTSSRSLSAHTVSSTGSGPDGCSIRFEHPLSADTPIAASSDGPFPPSVYEAITQYELHLRYYLQSVRYTGYPYAYHTVGSSFAVRADIYCKEGGMNRRQGGEDFYFIQKVAQRGNFSQCNTTCVFPSPRPSDRVPFGTGPVVGRLSSGKGPLMTYDPRPFEMLKELFDTITHAEVSEGKWSEIQIGRWNELLSDPCPEPLQAFLEEQDFNGAIEEIRSNSASAPAFRKRFWRWFNMFRIMKFLHYARERGYPDIPVGDAAAGLLRAIDPEGTGIPSVGSDLKKLLLIYRMLDLR